MQPGRRMDVTVELTKADGDTATFKGKGIDDAGQQTVSAQFDARGLQPRRPRPGRGTPSMRNCVNEWKARWALLTGELNWRDNANAGLRKALTRPTNLGKRTHDAEGPGRDRDRRQPRHRQGDRAGPRPRRGEGRVRLPRQRRCGRANFRKKSRRPAARPKPTRRDVADPAAAEKIVEAVVAEWGRVDILVNNAGVIRDELFVQMERRRLGRRYSTRTSAARSTSARPSRSRWRSSSGPAGSSTCRSIAADACEHGPDELRGQQGGDQLLHPRAGGGTGQPERDGERRRPRLHRDGHDRGRAEQGRRRQHRRR